MSAPKKPTRNVLFAGGAAGLAAIVVLCTAWFFGGSHLDTLTAGGQTYHLELATSGAQQQLGLGGRTSMPTDHGMLFVMPSDNSQCFWMKDMRFPLDIIWVSNNHKVTHVESNLAPDTYPKQYCAPAKYVVELNAGQATRANIAQDDTLTF